MDECLLEDMMQHLGRFETLDNYPSKVQGKFGVKYILYNSSVYEKNGEFIHTRCFACEIPELIYHEFRRARPL